jgi:hypothetical protein
MKKKKLTAKVREGLRQIMSTAEARLVDMQGDEVRYSESEVEEVREALEWLKQRLGEP